MSYAHIIAKSCGEEEEEGGGEEEEGGGEAEGEEEGGASIHVSLINNFILLDIEFIFVYKQIVIRLSVYLNFVSMNISWVVINCINFMQAPIFK